MVFWTTLLIVHGLLAVALLGAITHQAVALWWPVRVLSGSFVARVRAVPSISYVWAIIVLYIVTFIMGAWIYTQYRYTSRLALEQLRFFKTVGSFEIKEQFIAIGPSDHSSTAATTATAPTMPTIRNAASEPVRLAVAPPPRARRTIAAISVIRLPAAQNRPRPPRISTIGRAMLTARAR